MAVQPAPAVGSGAAPKPPVPTGSRSGKRPRATWSCSETDGAAVARPRRVGPVGLLALLALEHLELGGDMARHPRQQLPSAAFRPLAPPVRRPGQLGLAAAGRRSGHLTQP